MNNNFSEYIINLCGFRFFWNTLYIHTYIHINIHFDVITTFNVITQTISKFYTPRLWLIDRSQVAAPLPDKTENLNTVLFASESIVHSRALTVFKLKSGGATEFIDW